MRHPEQRPDEFFITNSTEEDYDNIGWKTKRFGDIAYRTNGLPVLPANTLFPVFVKQEEIRIANTKVYESLLKDQYEINTESLS